MLIIGLTGNIATGKSTVSRLLSQSPHNIPIIDADLLARIVVLPTKPAYNAIVSHFATTTPDLLYEPSADPDPHPSGLPNINRAVLGRRIFGNKADRDVLNGIVHPAVRQAMVKMIIAHWIQGCWAVVLDVPLLYEGGLDALCGTTIVVGIQDEKLQLKRLMARDPHLTEQEARDRMGSQMDIKQKAELADTMVWNDGGKEELVDKVNKFVVEAHKGRGQWWTWFLVVFFPVAIAMAGWTFYNRAQERRRMVASRKAKL